MEPSFLVYIFFCLAPFLVFLKLVLSSRKSNPISKLQLPPGNTGWPIVGETLEFGKMWKNGTPNKFFKERMDKYSQQVFRTSLIGWKTAVFCGVSGNKFVFSNENKLISVCYPTNAPKLFPHSGTTAAARNESSWRLRRMMLGFLKTEALANFVGIIDDLAKRHLEKNWVLGKEVGAVRLAKQFAFAAACRIFLNTDDPKRVQDLAENFDLVGAGIYSIPINLPGTALNRGIKAANSVRRKLLEIIRERKSDASAAACDDQDFLSQLLAYTDDNGKLLNELEVADLILAALIGNQDAIASAVSLIMKYLAEYPHIYEQVLTEQRSIAEAKLPGEKLNWQDLKNMKYAWNVAREVFRVVPPSKGNFRVALADFNYSNFFIPKGFKLYWSPCTTHMDAKYFPEPEKFDPSRFEKADSIPYAYVPFGGGSRICPGKDLARVLILIFVYNLVGKLKWETLIPDEKLEVLLVTMPAKGLPIRLYPNN